MAGMAGRRSRSSQQLVNVEMVVASLRDPLVSSGPKWNYAIYLRWLLNEITIIHRFAIKYSICLAQDNSVSVCEYWVVQ